jgi:hypothetical protein
MVNPNRGSTEKVKHENWPDREAALKLLEHCVKHKQLFEGIATPVLEWELPPEAPRHPEYDHRRKPMSKSRLMVWDTRMP